MSKVDMDLTGKKFHNWKVLCRDTNDKHYWICQCDCGTIKRVYYSSLLNEKSTSCGCKSLEHKKEETIKKSLEEVGKKYGRWEVIEPLEYTPNNPRVIVRCECGTVSVKNIYALKDGSSTSCGCYRTEIMKKNPYGENLDLGRKILREKYMVDGIPVVALTQNKSKNNTSGYKGVSYIKSSKKYRAYITINRKQKNLGSYDTAEEAYKARLEAEDIYFKPMIDKWEKENKD